MVYPALSAATASIAAATAIKNHKPRVFYITGGAPKREQTPRCCEYSHSTFYQSRPSSDGIGLGTLIMGGLLFGGL